MLCLVYRRIFKALRIGYIARMRSLPLLPCLICALSPCALPNSAQAAPWGTKLSWASHDAATTMAVSWVTPQSASTTIEYGIASTSENMLTGLPAQEIAGVGWFHELELTNLQPDTLYRYRVGAQGDWSPEYTFKTAPNDQCTPFTFVQLGDARSQDSRGPSRNWGSIHQEASAQGAHFFLNGGDLVKEGTEISQWRQWLEDSEMVNPTVPMMPALGNHDDGPGDGNSANYNRLFVLPTNTVTGTEDYYYFIYNNLLVFSLSTQTFEDWQVQMNWMQNVAAQHPSKWKVAYFHHPVYTTETLAGHEPNEKGQNPFYGPAFDAAGLDIIFQSHNHIYERFRPLRYNPADPEEGEEVQAYGQTAGTGRLYVVSGGSGAFLDPLIELTFNPANGSETRSADHHYMKISIAGNTLQYSAIRSTAGNSSGGGTLIDQLTLTRPGVDPCKTPQDPDGDGDGFPQSSDCRDDDPLINPGAAEICGNTIDEDCSGVADECPEPPVDMDNDGSPADTDCDDNNPNRYPEHPEVECDGHDNDCDCFEVCNGDRTDVCNPPPPDAGQAPDKDAQVDAGPQGQADLGASAPDAGASVPDLGAPAPEGSGCGCTSHTPRATPGALGFSLTLLIGLALLRRRSGSGW